MTPEHVHQSKRLGLLGDTSEEYDPDAGGDRLVIGLLGDEVRERWVCRDCMVQRGAPDHSCVAYVEHYRNGHGSTFVLCDFHLWLRLRVTVQP